MHHDLTHLDKYLSSDTNPREVVRALCFARYALVRCAECLESCEGLGDGYLDLLLLEDEFLKLDEHLAEITTRWK